MDNEAQLAEKLYRSPGHFCDDLQTQ